jgi:DNA-binding response OmpR family regulator
VLLDVAMPRMDGFQVARRLRLQPDLDGISIIGISGYANDSVRTRALESGFDHFLVKPVAPYLLEELLSQVVSGACLRDDRVEKQQAGAVPETPSSTLIDWPLLRFRVRWMPRRSVIGDRQGAKAVALVPR